MPEQNKPSTDLSERVERVRKVMGTQGDGLFRVEIKDQVAPDRFGRLGEVAMAVHIRELVGRSGTFALEDEPSAQ